MFDQVLDNLRRATESTMQLQQEMFRQWIQQWPQVPSVSTPEPEAVLPNSWVDRVHAFQRRWAEGVTDMLNKHRETLDTQYKAGIRTLEDAFRVAEAKNPEQFRKLAEELWRQCFETLKAGVESQIRDFQSVAEKGFEAMTKDTSKVKA